MKRYEFEDLFIGMTAEFSRVVDTQMINRFAELSGDKNPLHLDAEYAHRFGFKNQVVHGMLCSALFSELVGMHLPGESSLLTEISVIFVKPVLGGDKVVVSGSISQLSPAFKSAKIEATITNEVSDICVKANIGVLLR